MNIKQRQSLSLEEKIKLSKERIIEWYEFFDGNVYISFSGGKDSTVLLNLVRELYPEVCGVFINTGLEYPEIKQFVKTIDNVIWIVPKMSFHKVITHYGYPVISKQISLKIKTVQINRESYIARYYMTGYKKNGEYKKAGMISKKWQYLIDAPFKISNSCCDAIKKRPIHIYEKENHKKPYIGNMASDSNQRRVTYIKYGCNSFGEGRKSIQSNPLGFWTEQNIWEYINKYNIKYSKIYDMGLDRTGCMFCMFGVHLEKEPNRFQRMKRTHSKYYKYCMEKLELNKVLDYIGVKYI